MVGAVARQWHQTIRRRRGFRVFGDYFRRSKWASKHFGGGGSGMMHPRCGEALDSIDQPRRGQRLNQWLAAGGFWCLGAGKGGCQNQTKPRVLFRSTQLAPHNNARTLMPRGREQWVCLCLLCLHLAASIDAINRSMPLPIACEVHPFMESIDSPAAARPFVGDWMVRGARTQPTR